MSTVTSHSSYWTSPLHLIHDHSLHLETLSSLGFSDVPSLLVPSPLWVMHPHFSHGSSSFSDLSVLEWSRAQFMEYLTLPPSQAVLSPACILESHGELLKDADALAPLHCILKVKPRRFYYKYPGCKGWDPSTWRSHPLHILYSDDSQNESHAADLSSELQTPLSTHLSHVITWTDNRHLKSNMFTSKLLIFLPKPKPVFPTDL